MPYLYWLAFGTFKLQCGVHYQESFLNYLANFTYQYLCLLYMDPVNENVGAHSVDIGTDAPDMDIMHSFNPLDFHHNPGKRIRINMLWCKLKENPDRTENKPKCPVQQHHAY